MAGRPSQQFQLLSSCAAFTYFGNAHSVSSQCTRLLCKMPKPSERPLKCSGILRKQIWMLYFTIESSASFFLSSIQNAPGMQPVYRPAVSSKISLAWLWTLHTIHAKDLSFIYACLFAYLPTERKKKQQQNSSHQMHGLCMVPAHTKLMECQRRIWSPAKENPQHVTKQYE